MEGQQGEHSPISGEGAVPDRARFQDLPLFGEAGKNISVYSQTTAGSSDFWHDAVIADKTVIGVVTEDNQILWAYRGEKVNHPNILKSFFANGTADKKPHIRFEMKPLHGMTRAQMTMLAYFPNMKEQVTSAVSYLKRSFGDEGNQLFVHAKYFGKDEGSQGEIIGSLDKV